MLTGKITSIRSVLINKKLEIKARINTSSSKTIKAYMPEREISAIIPKDILIGSCKKSSKNILKTVNIIVKRFVKGRYVSVVFDKNRNIFFFLTWKNITFY